jgi:HEAT repeat protein
MAAILEELQGGDRRSLGRSREAVAEALRNPAAFNKLFAALSSEDPVVRARSADAAEKASRSRPEMLQPFKQQLLNELALIEQCEVRWHVAQMLPRLVMNEAELPAAVDALYCFLNDESKIVQVNAMQALADIAAAHTELQDELRELFAARATTGSAAVRARARKLAAQLGGAQIRTRKGNVKAKRSPRAKAQ